MNKRCTVPHRTVCRNPVLTAYWTPGQLLLRGIPTGLQLLAGAGFLLSEKVIPGIGGNRDKLSCIMQCVAMINPLFLSLRESTPMLNF